MVSIAFIHNSFPAGGAERVTIDIARYLKRFDGYRVFVYATRVSEGLLSDDVNDILTVRTLPSQARTAGRTKVVESYVVSDNIDVLVQVGKSLPGIEGIKERTGCKTVIACHGEPFWQRHVIMHRRQKGLVRRLMWHLWNRRRFEDGTLAMKMAKERTVRDYVLNDAYTVLCGSYRKEVIETLGLDDSGAHIYAIENAELPVTDVCYEKEKTVLFCGRFENWSKRIDRLLRIWAKVEPVLDGWRLVLVGDGRDGKMLRSLAAELKLERVSFEGMQRDVAGYYRKASIVCLTSETEGWPLALTEGQAQGCIGVAFDATSGIRAILDGECGFAVPAFDEAKFAETLIKVASMDADEQMKIRVNAVRKRSEYAPEVIAEKWKKLFDMLVIQ
ncbi:MAG: glycosyltransferase [Bacteroidales bacterium]|nr:glycosyltransferase [Bacteroidales bacterium]